MQGRATIDTTAKGIALAALSVVASPCLADAHDLGARMQICLDTSLSLQERSTALSPDLMPVPDRPPNWRYANIEQAQIVLNSFTGYAEASTRVAYLNGTTPDALTRDWPRIPGESWSAFATPQGDITLIVWESENRVGCQVTYQDDSHVRFFTAPIKQSKEVRPLGMWTMFEPTADGTRVELIEPSNFWSVWRPDRPDTHAIYFATRDKPALTN